VSVYEFIQSLLAEKKLECSPGAGLDDESKRQNGAFTVTHDLDFIRDISGNVLEIHSDGKRIR